MSQDKPKVPETNNRFVLLESEIEKQAGEIAGRVIGRTADGTMDIAGNIIGGLIGDRIREWRTRNLVESLSKTADYLRAKGIPLDRTKALPMGEAYAMFEEASKQDDPTIQDMWAALLANAMDNDSDVRIEPAFVATLSSLRGAEARILEFLWSSNNLRKSLFTTPSLFPVNETDNVDGIDLGGKNRSEFYIDYISKQYASISGVTSNKDITSALSNLMQLGCIYIPPPIFNQFGLTGRVQLNDYETMELLDNDKVENALNNISNSINITRSESVPSLISSSFNYPTINYLLTGYAVRLMQSCNLALGS